MADYDAYDEATLQQMLSDAASYEERAALRQALRKRKKDRGEATSRTKPRGNSVYNRFAGSTAKSSSKSGGTPNLPASSKPKQGVTSSTSPAPKKVPQSPIQSPVQQPVVPTPTPPPSPDPPAPTESESAEQESEPQEEVDIAPEDKEVHDEQASPAPEEIPEEENQEEIPVEDEKTDEPDLGTNKEVSPAEHDHSTGDLVEPPHDSTDNRQNSSAGSAGDLHAYLVAYVNQTLFLDPPLPSRGKALYDTCSDPTHLCKLINKSVSGTVDLRALSKVTGSTAQRAEAVQDNMMLVTESARAIGCQITESTQDKILHKEPETIDNFLVDLIRARVVHMPGMEDEPATTFSDMQSLFQKLHISVDEDQESSKPVSWRDDPDKVRKALQANSPPAKGGSWKENQSDTTDLTYEQRAAKRKAEREQRQKEKEAGANSVELTYEERAAQRKAERERRRKEREALAK